MEIYIDQNSSHIDGKINVKWSMNKFNYFHIVFRVNEFYTIFPRENTYCKLYKACFYIPNLFTFNSLC